MLRLLFSLLVTAAAAVPAAGLVAGEPLRLGSGAGAPILGDPVEIAALWLAALAAIWLLPWIHRRGPAWLAPALAAGALVAVAAAVLLPPARPPGAASGAAPAERLGRRTLLVAVDGMSWERIAPLVRAGRLPNLARMMREGASGVLHSLPAERATSGRRGYWSPVVWTSIATGVGPRRHGVTDFSVRGADGRLELAASHHRRAPAFWNLFGAFGVPVGVIGWWASWPAEEVVGVMASSGLGLRGGRPDPFGVEAAPAAAPTERLAHPPELEDELRALARPAGDLDLFLDRRLFPFSSYPILGETDRQSFDSVARQDLAYLELARHLLARDDLGLVAVYFEGIDLVSHLFWRYLDRPEALINVSVPDGFDEHARIVDRYYGVVDGWIGELARLAGDEATVVVVSDHGFRRDPGVPAGADHFGEGVLFARGEGIRAGFDLNRSLAGWLAERVHGATGVLDVLPTLLYLHGLPIADDLEGRVLHRLLKRGYRRTHPEARIATYGDFEATRRVELPEADRQEQLERLRTLGYID